MKLSNIELQAAFIATSNYTPKTGSWKQHAQSRACIKLQNELLKRNIKSKRIIK